MTEPAAIMPDLWRVYEDAERLACLRPADRRFWVMAPDPGDERKNPLFSIKYCASVFFGRSAAWIRAHEERGNFALDGSPMEFSRDSRGARAYRLQDTEPMAWSLYERSIIDYPRLYAAIQVTRWVAIQHGLLKADDNG